MLELQEHKHSGQETLMSGGANACPICQALKIMELEHKLFRIKEIAQQNSGHKLMQVANTARQILNIIK